MLFVINKLNMPAITHVNYSVRIQTVSSKTSPLYNLLISEFKKKTGCPLIVNTSFNVRGEPIVYSPTDAFKCFMGIELNVLSIENFILFKKDQNPFLKKL